jgi:polar amino acid transport system ATP-binding protein
MMAAADTTAPAPAVSFRDVSVWYGDRQILDRLNLAVQPGERCVVLGPSGAGKSTLVRCVNFLTPYQDGEVRVNGQLVGYRDNGKGRVADSEVNLNRLRTRVGIVFQRYNLFPHRTVTQNLIEGPLKVLKVPRQEALDRAAQTLERVGLADRGSAYPGELSGGQQQRVAIARALCMRPEVLLLDEVTSALDPELVGEVTDVIQGLADDGMSMMIVTHQLRFAKRCASTVTFLENGRIQAKDHVERFFGNPPTDRIARYLDQVS